MGEGVTKIHCLWRLIETFPKMTPDNFPEILICPEPGADLSVLLTAGYQDSIFYQLGITGNGTKYEFFRWSGRQAESVEEMVRNVSVFPTDDDCPKVRDISLCLFIILYYIYINILLLYIIFIIFIIFIYIG